MQAPHYCACVAISSYLWHRVPGLGTVYQLHVHVYKTCMLESIIYKVGNYVAVVNDEVRRTPYKGRIKEIFSHKHNGQIKVYFVAAYSQNYLHVVNGVDGDE